MGSGLYHTMGIGAESLAASRQGVDTAGHNIANAQVEGYSRQRLNLRARIPVYGKGGIIIGNGTVIESIQRSHDKFIENQVNHAQMAGGASSARFEKLRALEQIFSPELQASVSDELTTFFNALQDLGNFPEELTVRTYVRESAQNLTQAFKRVDQSLREQRRIVNDEVVNETKEISDILKSIAVINVRLSGMEGGQSGEANDLRDQRDKMVRELSGKMRVHTYEDQFGMVTIRGPRDMSLVEGAQAVEVGVQRNSEDPTLVDVVVSDFDRKRWTTLSEGATGSRLGALLEIRDHVVPTLIENNNHMANALVDRFNAVHRDGFGIKDFSESRGADFFKPVRDPSQAAQEIELSDLILGSTNAIAAASSPNAPGDNVVVNRLLGVNREKLLDNGNASLGEFYANYVGVLGLEVNRADHVREADEVLIADLKGRRESVSGVSLDEEAMNLLRWQTSFTASSKIITAVDEMLETLLTLKR